MPLARYVDPEYLWSTVVSGSFIISAALSRSKATRKCFYLDVIHIAIVYGERDLLELRFGSVRSRDLLDLTCLSASQQGQCDESFLLPRCDSHRNCIRRTRLIRASNRLDQSVRSNDLIASVLFSRSNTTARSILQLDRNRRRAPLITICFQSYRSRYGYAVMIIGDDCGASA
eukprot:COSAG06_NODE_20_length_33882_cov_18.856969_9_plen_173_part_00